MVTFKGDYDKSKFYSLMGKFFAEKKYKKLMPYLYNSDDIVWTVETDKNNKNEVVGFIGYIEKENKINIVYCFVEDSFENKTKLENKLLNKVINKFNEFNIFIELEKNFNLETYLNKKFVVYKESTNYWYLERLKDNENI